jgi:hypothetical protein
MTAPSHNPVGGWDRHWSVLFVLACVAGFTLVAGCQGGGSPVEGAAGDPRADAGTEGPTDAAAAACRGIADDEECRSRGNCQWMTVTCDGGGIAGGCYPERGWLEEGPECGATGDTGGASGDVAVSCADVDGQQTCRSRAGCEWWDEGCGEPTCLRRDDVPADSGCADVTPGGDTTGTDDAGYEDTGQQTSGDTGGDAATSDSDLDASEMACRTYSDESSCGSAAHCKWWVDSCDGEVVEERCVSSTASPEPSECQTIPPEECYEREDESSCPAPNCAWVEQGCGSGPTGTESLSNCLPKRGCRSDSDCPASHECTTLWLDPCHDSSCVACGGEVNRCVPPSLLRP